ncbi:MAG: FAD-dependent oxidoreductase, partial [Oceanicaulis sp.]
MADLTCDVAVIGAGTAGLAAERSAREAGATTRLIDPDFAGTLCATAGCMPSKLLIAAANAAKDVRKASNMGVGDGAPAIDGKAVMARVQRMRDHFIETTQSS